RALRREREGAGRRCREGCIDRMGDERLGRCVDVAELDVFGHEARLLEEFAGFEHRAEADAESAGPVPDLDLSLRRGAGRAGERGPDGQQEATNDHGAVSVGCASSEARNWLVKATACGVPMRGCGRSTSICRLTRPGRADSMMMRSASTTASSTS